MSELQNEYIMLKEMAKKSAAGEGVAFSEILDAMSKSSNPYILRKLLELVEKADCSHHQDELVPYRSKFQTNKLLAVAWNKFAKNHLGSAKKLLIHEIVDRTEQQKTVEIEANIKSLKPSENKNDFENTKSEVIVYPLEVQNQSLAVAQMKKLDLGKSQDRKVFKQALEDYLFNCQGKPEQKQMALERLENIDYDRSKGWRLTDEGLEIDSTVRKAIGKIDLNSKSEDVEGPLTLWRKGWIEEWSIVDLHAWDITKAVVPGQSYNKDVAAYVAISVIDNKVEVDIAPIWIGTVLVASQAPEVFSDEMTDKCVRIMKSMFCNVEENNILCDSILNHPSCSKKSKSKVIKYMQSRKNEISHKDDDNGHSNVSWLQKIKKGFSRW